MAYNYNQGQAQMPQNQNYQMPSMGFQQQNVQPLFPQPQGNVYNINSTLEVANVPTGAGISVALCLNEGFMYIKTMQNGNPMFWAYKITPYDNTTQKSVESEVEREQELSLEKHFEKYETRFNNLETQVNSIQSILKNKKEEEWKL